MTFNPKPIAAVEAITAVQIPPPSAPRKRPRLRPMFCDWLKRREKVGRYRQGQLDHMLLRNIRQELGAYRYDRRYTAILRIMESMTGENER